MASEQGRRVAGGRRLRLFGGGSAIAGLWFLFRPQALDRVGQFIATIVVSRQIDYSLNAGMGFEKNAIVYFDTNYGDTEAHRVILRDKINAIPGVSMVSRSNPPASYSGGMRGDILVYRDGQKEIKPP